MFWIYLINWFHQFFLTAAKYGASVKQIKLNECTYNFVKRCLVLNSLHKILLFMASWEQCRIKLIVILLLYWLKVINKDENKYVNVIYEMMLRDIEINDWKTNWTLLVRDLLGNLGFFEVWLNQGVGDVNLFLTIVQQRLKDQYIQGWMGEIENSSRALFYRYISGFYFQPYLVITIRKFCTTIRTAMTKLRVSSH